MKIRNAIAFSVVVLAGSLMAQEPAAVATPAKANAAASVHRTTTFSDQYCSGFINKERLSMKSIVAGGIDTPNTARFTAGDYIFLMGDGLKVGEKMSIVRELHDANRYELFNGQFHMIRATGQPYADLGLVSIVGHQNNVFIGKVDFSCEAILAGDIIVPQEHREQVTYEVPSHFERFPNPNKQLSGRIVMAKDFDFFLGNGAKVYLNVGAKDGVRVGDYFRVTRDFTQNLSSEVDSLSYKSPMGDDTQTVEPVMETDHQFVLPGHPVIKVKDFPRVAMGEVVVLSVTPNSATGMVSYALEDLHAGDTVEKISGPNDTASSQQ